MGIFADSFTEKDAEQTISERFDQIANRCSNKVAIKAETDSLTYAELNYRGDRLADEICASVAHDQKTLAAVFRDVRNSIGLATTYIGAMKAGKTCLSLNSSEAIDRDLLFAKPPIVITDSDNISAVEKLKTWDWKPTIWNIDDLRFGSMSKSLAPPRSVAQVSSYDPSFVLSTSGTSGRPKAAILTHRGDVFLARCVGMLHELQPGDIITCFRNNSAGVNDFFTGFLNGLQVSTRDIFTAESLSGLADWINDESVTIFKTVSSAYKYAVRPGKEFPNVRIVDIGGEVVTPIYFQAFKDLFPRSCRFRPRYSSNETRVIAYGDFGHDSEIGDLIPYTMVMPYNEVFIVDDNRKPLPNGVVGEIAVKSPILSLGYLNDPLLTQEKFWPAEDGKRIYFTRDRGFIRPEDGCLFVTGKMDLANDKLVLDKVTRKLAIA